MNCPLHRFRYLGAEPAASIETNSEFIEPICHSALICIAYKRNLRNENENNLVKDNSNCLENNISNSHNIIILRDGNSQTDDFVNVSVQEMAADNSDSSVSSEYLDIKMPEFPSFYNKVVESSDVTHETTCVDNVEGANEKVEKVNEDSIKNSCTSRVMEESIYDAEKYLSPSSMLNSSALTYIIEPDIQDMLIPQVSSRIAFICSACANKSTHSAIKSTTEQYSSIQSVNPDEKISKNISLAQKESDQDIFVDATQISTTPVKNVELSASKDSVAIKEDIPIFYQAFKEKFSCDYPSIESVDTLVANPKCKQFEEKELHRVNSAYYDITLEQCKIKEIDDEQINPNQFFEKSSNCTESGVEENSYSLSEDLQYQPEKLTLKSEENRYCSNLPPSFVDEFKASYRLKRLEERIKNRGKRVFSSLHNSPDKRRNVYGLTSTKSASEPLIYRIGSCIDLKSSTDSINPFSSLNSPLNLAVSCPASIHIEDDIQCNLQDIDNETNTDCKALKRETDESKLDHNISGKQRIQSQENFNEICNDVEETLLCKDKNSNYIHNNTEKEFSSKTIDDISVFHPKDTHSPDSTTDSELSKIFHDNLVFDHIECESNSKLVFEGQEKENELLQGYQQCEEIFSNCEFNVHSLESFPVQYKSAHDFECYDELFDELENNNNDCATNIIENKVICAEGFHKNQTRDYSCCCCIEAIPLYHPKESVMRETNGTLRGLLKKPNRPPPLRKNRVVFDETRNQFFEADYIILIREDCPYDEEDEEPCTCGEHELVRICCDDSCNCTYSDDGRTPPSPKFAPPIEFVDQATLSPPDGYKDAGGNLIDSALQGALGGHVFGAQHIQQLQVIQRLQQQRAAMLAARAATQSEQHQNLQSNVCTECAECAECAAKQHQEECDSHSDDSPIDMPAIPILPLRKVSPEKRIIQKEIVAGEERPKLIALKHCHDNEEKPDDGIEKPSGNSNVKETLERESNNIDEQLKQAALNQTINGILKGGKLWKEQGQCDDSTNTTSDEESSSKRSVRFCEEAKARECGEGESESGSDQRQPIDYVSHSIKRHSSLFHNALRPNSALRQLFPSTKSSQSPADLTHEALKALEDSKKGDPNFIDADTENIKKTIERNVFRRSLIKYEPKKKVQIKEMTSLEERIRQLTCDIDIPLNEDEVAKDSNDNPLQGTCVDKRDSPAGEENPNQSKYAGDKSFSPSSSTSSTSSNSVGSTYKKITDLFNREKKQDKIPEVDENIHNIVPQDCRCPAGPDIGMGVQIQGGHTQIHQPPPPPPRHPDTKRQFLSTLVPLTACVAGQREEFSYYTLAQPSNRTSIASSHCTEYSVGDIDKALIDDDTKKVAPDVIVGTPGQETDELAVFVQQESSRTETLKKRYGSETVSDVVLSDEDDEQNDYGFNKRPQVKGIKVKSSSNEILQEMQDQLLQTITTQQVPATIQTQTAQTQIVHSSTLPRPHTAAAMQISAKQVTAHHQHTASWSYYPEQANVPIDPHGNYYHLPTHARHSYHGHEAVYQNSNTVAVQQIVAPQPQYARYTRSPTRRPESPPPLRNFHQTMVLIPYNSNPYQQFNNTEVDPSFGRKHNVVEYQQVTQQTIRVPFGYHLPGMQLHVVSGRGTAPHYNSLPRFGNTNNMSFASAAPDQQTERSPPEGSDSQIRSDQLSPTNSQNSLQTSNVIGHSNATTLNKSPATAQTTSAVYYAMNI